MTEDLRDTYREWWCILAKYEEPTTVVDSAAEFIYDLGGLKCLG